MRGVGACMRGVVACPNGQAAHDCAAWAACLLAGWRVQPLGRLYGPARRASRSDRDPRRRSPRARGVRSVSVRLWSWKQCVTSNNQLRFIFRTGRTDEAVANVDGWKPLTIQTYWSLAVRTGPRAALVHLLRIRRMRDRRARAPRRPRTAPRLRSRGRAAPPPPPQPRGC